MQEKICAKPRRFLPKLLTDSWICSLKKNFCVGDLTERQYTNKRKRGVFNFVHETPILKFPQVSGQLVGPYMNSGTEVESRSI